LFATDPTGARTEQARFQRKKERKTKQAIGCGTKIRTFCYKAVCKKQRVVLCAWRWHPNALKRQTKESMRGLWHE
jgi:hypothetical protein